MTGPEAAPPDRPSRDELPWVLEALLLASEEPLGPAALARATGSGERSIRTGLERLAADYEARGLRLQEEAVQKQGEHFVLKADPGIRLDVRAHKMSKSRGNVVNPDNIIAEYGADAFRLYEMFMGPLEQVKPWNTRGVTGTFRFLNRTWRLLSGEPRGVVDQKPDRAQQRMLHRTLQRVTQDIEALRMNTAIAALMEFVNAAYKWDAVPRAVAEPFVLMLSPFAPHLAEALWERLGHRQSLAYEAWPAVDESCLVEDTVAIPVQVNGKVRATVHVPTGTPRKQVLALARKQGNVMRHLDGVAVRKEIYVPGRIVNIVAR